MEAGKISANAGKYFKVCTFLKNYNYKFPT